MFNTTWFAEISPMVNASATLVQAFATIGLLVVTYWLYKATKIYGEYVEKQTSIMDQQLENTNKQTENYKIQTGIMNDQLTIAEKQSENSKHQSEIMEKQIKFGESQTKLMEGQVSYLKEQERIMKERAERETNIEKYRRLRDEMDNFIAPLYFAAKTVKTNKDFQELSGVFGLVDYKSEGGRLESRRDHYLFWVRIKKNMYLNQSGKLFEFLEKHFQYDDEFSEGKADAAKKNFLMNRRELIQEIIDNSYPKLKNEIDTVERELGIQKNK
ncbi:MAG: hypothetical protein PHS80_11040 [Methanothrix sp.]|nr:hypothetical protein [Methanothrix sp.]